MSDAKQLKGKKILKQIVDPIACCNDKEVKGIFKNTSKLSTLIIVGPIRRQDAIVS